MNQYEKQLKAIEVQTAEILAKSREITESAANEGRALEDDEKKQLESNLAQLDVLKGKKGEVEASLATLAKVEDLGKSIVVEEKSDGDLPEHRKAESIGEAFVKSQGYLQAKADGFRGEWSTGAIDMEGKTLLTEASGGASLVGTNAPDIQPGILPKLFMPLSVASLMASGTTASNLVRYMKETTATSGAAGVAEGGTKPESTLVFSSVDEPVKKIATMLPVTDEMIEDVPQLSSYINARLSLFVRIEEERQLLNGAGTNELVGLVSRIPANNLGMRKSGANVTDADHIFRAISRVREAFLEPDGIVIHPNDWEGIVLLKDSTNRYVGTGPFSSEQGPTLWGLRVVVTTAVTEGAPIIGAFGTAAQVYRKGGLSVEASNSHSTYFAENKTAIRAEERLALAVYRPEAFATADLGVAGSAT